VVSITLALLVRVDGEDYALPLAAVLETVPLTPEASHEINNAGVLRWRDGVLPLVDLGCLFGTAQAVRREGFVVVLEVGGRRRGLTVDTLEGVREIVVKSLDPMVGRPRGIGGSTILGDGRAVLILDPPDLMEVAPFVRKSA
jgi:two-component system chemotaxis sensor kinase CheA